MIWVARAMPSASTTRRSASLRAISTWVERVSRSCETASLFATACATTAGYWMLPTTTFITSKGVSLVFSWAQRVSSRLTSPILSLSAKAS